MTNLNYWSECYDIISLKINNGVIINDSNLTSLYAWHLKTFIHVIIWVQNPFLITFASGSYINVIINEVILKALLRSAKHMTWIWHTSYFCADRTDACCSVIYLQLVISRLVQDNYPLYVYSFSRRFHLNPFILCYEYNVSLK